VIDVDFDEAGMTALTRSGEVQDLMLEAGQRGADWCRDNAPVLTGEYRDSFVVLPADVDLNGDKRAGAILTNTSDHAWAVEWGQGAQHTLARSVDAIEGP
jgi:hypothetical protein